MTVSTQSLEITSAHNCMIPYSRRSSTKTNPGKRISRSSNPLANTLAERTAESGRALGGPCRSQTIRTNRILKRTTHSTCNGRPKASAKGRSHRLPRRRRRRAQRTPRVPAPPRGWAGPRGSPLRPTPGQGPPPASPASFLWEVRLLSRPPPSRRRLAAAPPPGTG